MSVRFALLGQRAQEEQEERESLELGRGQGVVSTGVGDPKESMG